MKYEGISSVSLGNGFILDIYALQEVLSHIQLKASLRVIAEVEMHCGLYSNIH